VRSLALFAGVVGLAGVAILTVGAQDATAQTAAGIAVPTDLITGQVISAEAGWTSGARKIVTRSVIRTADGIEHRVHQLGGTVDGIGMRVYPGTTLLQVGQSVQVTTRSIPFAASSPVMQVVSQRLPGALFSVRTKNDPGVPLYWSANCIFITPDSAGTSHIAGDGEFAAIQGVFSHWATEMNDCSYMTFSMEERVSSEVGLDGVNVVKFRDSEWCPPDAETQADCYSPGAAGLTTLFFRNTSGKSNSGEILDADIELNGVNFAISVGGVSEGAPQCLSDLANTLTHEVGHLLGMDHTCWVPQDEDEVQPVDHTGTLVPRCFPASSLQPYITEATMYNFQECGETKKATLHDDDVADGVCLMYPADDDPGVCAVPKIKNDGCSASGGGQFGPLALLGLAFLAFRRRRHS